MSTLLSLWTVVAFVFFIGVIVWVLFSDRKQFDEAAQIPFSEGPESQHKKQQEMNHG